MKCCGKDMVKFTDSVIECKACGNMKFIAEQTTLYGKLLDYAIKLKAKHKKKTLPSVKVLPRPSLVEYWWRKDTKYCIRIAKLS